MSRTQTKLYLGVILLLVTLIVIILYLLIIPTLDKNFPFSFNFNSLTPSSSSQVKFAGYDYIKKELAGLIANDSGGAKIEIRKRGYNKLIALENKNITTKGAYIITEATAVYVASAYSEIHDPKDRKMLNDLGAFAKTNFPKLYNEDSFSSECQDTTCQDEPTPPEITKIIKGINDSDLPSVLKGSLTNNLIIAAYITKNNPYDKYVIYDFVVKQLQDYTPDSPSKVTLTIADELQTFINHKYPAEKEKYLKDIETVKSRQQKAGS